MDSDYSEASSTEEERPCRLGEYTCPLLVASLKGPLAHLVSGPLMLSTEHLEEMVTLFQAEIHSNSSLSPIMELLLSSGEDYV
jgi:hypothetical protein